MSIRVGLVPLALALALLAGCRGGESGPAAYLALGDSLAAGVGATDPATTAYVPLFHAFLAVELGDDLELHNVGVSGETTTSLIEEGQLDAALAVLERNSDGDDGNDVAVISLNAGGNDLGALVAEGGPCAPPILPGDPDCLGAVPRQVAAYRDNLMSILRALRDAAGPQTRIFVVTQMNPFSGTGNALDLPGEVAVALLNEQTKAVAADASLDVTLVDVAPLFAGRGPALTHAADAMPDGHPNDEGYRVIADALAAAYGGVSP